MPEEISQNGGLRGDSKATAGISTDEVLPPHITPLYLAITNRDFVTATKLLNSGNSIDGEPTDDGYTLLHGVVQHGDLEGVQFLLAAGCPHALNSFDYVARTPLIWAAKEGRVEMVKLLLAAGADVNANDDQKIGNTAIHEAVCSGHLSVVELLLSAGADPNIRGWMQINAVTCARLKLEENSTSENHRQILALLEGQKD